MGREFTQRAVFSAGCNHLQTVQAIRDGSRKNFERRMAECFRPRVFAGGTKFYNYEAPEDAEGTIRDMTTPGRQNLIFDQTVAQARNFAWKENLLADDRPHAWQLVRVGTRKEPRDWDTRWKDAYAQLSPRNGWAWMPKENVPWCPAGFGSCCPGGGRATRLLTLIAGWGLNPYRRTVCRTRHPDGKILTEPRRV